MESHERVSPRSGTTEPFTFQTQQEASLNKESFQHAGLSRGLGCKHRARQPSGLQGKWSGRNLAPVGTGELRSPWLGEDSSSMAILKMLSNERFCKSIKC